MVFCFSFPGPSASRYLLSIDMDKKQNKMWRQLIDEYGRRNVASTIELAKRYLDLYPKDGAAWIVIGDMYIDIAKYDDALDAIRNAKKYAHKKRLDMVYSQYGELYRAKGNYKVAEKWFRKAVEYNPTNTRNHIFLGALLAKMGRFDEAKKCHKEAVRLKTDTWDEAHHNLGLIYRAEGKYKTELKHFDKAIEIDPNYSSAIEERSDVLNAINIKVGR